MDTKNEKLKIFYNRNYWVKLSNDIDKKTFSLTILLACFTKKYLYLFCAYKITRVLNRKFSNTRRHSSTRYILNDNIDFKLFVNGHFKSTSNQYYNTYVKYTYQYDNNVIFNFAVICNLVNYNELKSIQVVDLKIINKVNFCRCQTTIQLKIKVLRVITK